MNNPSLPSKEVSEDAIFALLCMKLEAQLLARKSADEITYFDVEEVSYALRSRLTSMLIDLGWKVSAEYCPPDYDELWIS